MGLPVTQVRIGRLRIAAELAAGPWSRMLGLMFRRRLPRHRGMLLCFRRPGNHGIHMWNVRFPLDVIFITAAGRVARIRTARPGEFVFRPGRPVLHVLEINAGLCRRHGIRVGARCRVT